MASSSGFWGRNNGNTYSMLVNRNPVIKRIKRVASVQGMADIVGLINAAVGASAGGAALKTHKQIKNVSGGLNQGGARTYENVDDVNRNTTSGDVATLKAMFTNNVAPTTYPTNGSKGKILA